MVRGWHRRPHSYRVRRRVDLHVEEVTQAGMRVDGAVGQLDPNVDVRVLPGVFGAAPEVVEKVALADLEGDIDGVLADDGRELAGGGLDQIAFGDDGDSDPSIDGRVDLRVAEIDLRLVELRLRLHDAGLRRLLVGFALVDRGLRDVLVAHQLLAALELQLGVDLGRLGLGNICARLLDGRLIGRLLDAEQEIALLDVLPLFEVALLEEARHAGDDIDLVDGGEAPDVVDRVRDLTAHDRSDGNGGWRRRTLRGGDAARYRDTERAHGGFPGDSGGHRGSPGCKRYVSSCVVTRAARAQWCVVAGAWHSLTRP